MQPKTPVFQTKSMKRAISEARTNGLDDYSAPPPRIPDSIRGWGLDFYFGGEDLPVAALDREGGFEPQPEALQMAMDRVVDEYVRDVHSRDDGPYGLSANQQGKREREERRLLRQEKALAKLSSN
jgi:hypothetical protein